MFLFCSNGSSIVIIGIPGGNKQMVRRGPDPNALSVPGLSGDMSDFLTEHVVVVLDAESAELWGAFEETALTDKDAWDSNGDLTLSIA
jgi:hypothetical protein